jgi:very-short-patch-repair endonuclease
MEYFDFLTPSGRINSMKVKEQWLKKHNIDFYNSVQNFILLNNISSERPVEQIWYFLNSIEKTVSCKNNECSNVPKFIGLSSGFSEYCSYKCANSSDEVKRKKIESSIKRYGVENPYQAKEIIEKIKKTNLERHGVENPMQSQKIKEEMIKRSINSTGKSWALSDGGKANLKKKENLRIQFEKKYNDLEIISYSDQKFGLCTFRKKECNHEFSINKWQLYQRRKLKIEECTICNPIGSFTETVWHKELSDFLKSAKIKFIENDRSVLGNLELDFYLPDFNCAIELDGLYWHSIDFKEPLYHFNKTERCEQLGIQLIHVFEDEWVDRKDVVLSRIMNILKKSTTKIYARKCEIREISGTSAREFVERNHLQGNIPASKRLGLFYKNELVSVMTFGALRRALGSSPIDGVYEMYRFCNKTGFSVVGGASKLLKYFIKNEKPSKIISYADRRWSTGTLYLALGFSMVRKTSPNFWYVNGSSRLHRFSYTNKKLISLASDGKSKDDVMLEMGLTKIYDSGNLKFSLSISSS